MARPTLIAALLLLALVGSSYAELTWSVKAYTDQNLKGTTKSWAGDFESDKPGFYSVGDLSKAGLEKKIRSIVFESESDQAVLRVYHSSCKDFARDKHYTDLKPGTYKTLPTRWDRRINGFSVIYKNAKVVYSDCKTQ